ncbi:MAG TPA: dihydropteroate synthase [Myxococcota bacterium]|nr:dihydropteroate synthase [Myxococcota bacterium]
MNPMYAVEQKAEGIAAAALDCGRRPLLMGILNITPDSFSDGGLYVHPDIAFDRALQMVAQGADIIDIGGETTRPGAAQPIDEAEELKRVIPIIQAVAKATDVPISIDTRHASVASAAIQAGACIVNDVSGFRFDPGMRDVLVSHRPVAVAMHMRGTPADMQQHTDYQHLLGSVICETLPAVLDVIDAGLPKSRVWLDPGIGFAKTPEQSLALIRDVDKLAALGFPVLVGPSRKSFIGAVLNRRNPTERVFGTAAAVTAAVLKGARVIRVHDVFEMLDVIKVAAAISEAALTEGRN